MKLLLLLVATVVATLGRPFAADWESQTGEDAKRDLTVVIFNGQSPNKLACDTTLREMPDGSWVMVMLGGGDTEPRPQNGIFITRSTDQGKTWSPMEPVGLGFKREGDTVAMVPSELMVRGARCTLFFSTHDGLFGGWKSWLARSDDSCRSWSAPEPVPGRLQDRTFIRNHLVTRDGRILVPFQHYVGQPPGTPVPSEKAKRRPFNTSNPRNGVLMSSDGGQTWTEHGDIRITKDDRYSGWPENNIVELADGRIAMIIRADRLGGVLCYAESTDSGKTWPEFARKSDIPNPGSKATLYPLGGDTVALLHNPNAAHRSPLALWISFDGLKTWPYQRVLVPESSDGPTGRLNYPDGFISKDRAFLHFAFDDNRHRAIQISAKLPPVPDAATNSKVTDSGRADYLKIVRTYADTMLDPAKGRDHFGPEPTPLFATVLDRQSYEIPAGKVEDLVRARVSPENKFVANPHYDENLLQILYALATITGEARYAGEADRTIEYFVKHCQEERYGFFTWGEHVGWDLTTEALGGFPKEKPEYAVHEFWRPWIYWDKSFQFAPANCHRFAQALWKYQLDWTKPGIAWSRHAQMLGRTPSRRGYEFPRHGGFYIATWAQAYRHTKDPEMLKAIEAVVDYYLALRDPKTGAINHCSSIPNWLRPESTVSLAISLWDSLPLVPEALGSKMRELGNGIDEVFLKLPHDPGPGGKGLVLTATLDLQPTALWMLESGWTTNPPPENVLPPRHKAYTEGWVSAYVGPVPHSTMIGYCIERHRQVQLEGYKRLILLTADGYLESEPSLEPYVENGERITPKVDTGTIGRVIGLMNYAWRLSGEPKYLQRAEWFCDWAVGKFWAAGLPLPLPSVPFSEKQNFYSASARCDTLAMCMLETWLLKNRPETKIQFRWTDL